MKDHLGDNRVVINSSGAIMMKSHYYPSGMRFFPESTTFSAALPYRYNGKELETMNGLNQYDYGARRRKAGLPIWTAVDPLAEKYYSISPYAYCGGNPVNRIDIDGRYIHVAINAKAETLKEINSRAAGTFGINRSGNLYLIKREGSIGFSTYYRDKLISAIDDTRNVISISKGTSFLGQNGDAKDVDRDAGGGVTIDKTRTKQDGSITKEADVILSGNKNEGLKDTDGNNLRDEPADILMHELLGHAITWTDVSDTGNAVENENKARIQLKEGENQERKEEPNHNE